MNVLLHPRVDKYLRRLLANIENRIKEKLKLPKIHPFRYLEHYEGEGVYKMRIGQYRALIDVEEDNVLVRVIDHRSCIYKR